MRGTNKRMGGRPQAQLIQAQKTLASKDGVLTAALWKCRLELAKKKGFRDIEASKDAVEVAGRDFMQASSTYCMYVEEDPAESFPDPAEEVRRARYECKLLTDLMELVVEKAEEYLEFATDENSLDELCEDEDGGNELDAKVEQVSTVNEVNKENEVNVKEESSVNEESGMVCIIKEVAPEVSYVLIKEVELHIAHNVQVEIVAEVQVKQNGAKVKSDENVEAEVEVSGMKEVKNLKDDDQVAVFDAKVNNGKVGLRLYDKKAEVKQSRPANWDPGELADAKDQMEMLDVEEVANLVNNDKVARSGGVKAMMFFYALSNLLLYTSDTLVALCIARFVNSFSPLSIVELSDYE